MADDFARALVYTDHGTASTFTRYRFELDLPAGFGIPASADGGRLVVEFPIDTSLDTFFLANLGNPMGKNTGDNTAFPCQSVGGFAFTTTTDQKIECWMELGDTTGYDEKYTRIWIDNFDQINPSTTGLKFDFPKVLNPAFSTADVQLVAVNVYATNVADGFPGVKIAQHNAKYVTTIRQNTDTIGLTTAALTAADTIVSIKGAAPSTTTSKTSESVSWIFDIAADPNSASGDIIVIDLDSAYQSATQSPRYGPAEPNTYDTGDSGIPTADCTYTAKDECIYYFDSHQLMIRINANIAADTTVTIDNVINPAYVLDADEPTVGAGHIVPTIDIWRRTNVIGVQSMTVDTINAVKATPAPFEAETLHAASTLTVKDTGLDPKHA